MAFGDLLINAGKFLCSNLLTVFVCVRLYFNQVAEIISDVREPILPISEPVDENEKRRKQVRVSDTSYTTSA